MINSYLVNNGLTRINTNNYNSQSDEVEKLQATNSSQQEAAQSAKREHDSAVAELQQQLGQAQRQADEVSVWFTRLSAILY